MPPQSPVARNILNAIRDRQMTPAEFARKVDINESYFSRLKNGTIREPARPQLEKIAEGLGTSVDVLIHGAPDPTPDEDVLLRRLIERRVGNRAGVEMVEAILNKIKGRSAVDQNTVLSVVDSLLDRLPPSGS